MVPYTLYMIYYPHTQAFDQYWLEVNGCHKYKYSISFKVSTGFSVINDFVTIYNGYDTDVWFYKQYNTTGVLFMIYVHDMDWQALCKLHNLKTDQMAYGVLTNPRFDHV
jgi:hypothetical protein